MGGRGAGLTKTQQLRQAKSAALAKEYESKHERTTVAESATRRRRSTYEPKKVDFSKPTMTKAMMARMKQAEKFKEEYERKQQETMHSDRRPRRTATPIGGDARMGRERTPKKRTSPPTSPLRGSPMPRQDSIRPKTPRRLGFSAVPGKTNELARTMNADVVHAEPIGEGPIDNIIIPPGVVSNDRTTIISVKPSAGVAGAADMTSEVANRSIQVISETLDEQDAMEAAAVQGKLSELQQSRREFVMAVANVGGNAVNIDEGGSRIATPVHTSPIRRIPPPQVPVRRIYKLPDAEDPSLRVEYGRDHPDVVAAREFLQRTRAEREQREAARRMEDQFARLGLESTRDELHLDVPFEEEIMHQGDISWEEDEETGMQIPLPSRIKASMPAIPQRQEHYQYAPFDPEELERFFDVQHYPPCAMNVPPPGREELNPDLWELDDPWYIPPQQPDMPDLIDFST